MIIRKISTSTASISSEIIDLYLMISITRRYTKRTDLNDKNLISVVTL